MLKRIERYTEQSIKMHTIEGLEPKYKLRTGGPSSDRPRGNSGPRHSSGGYGGGNNAGFGGNRTGGYAGNKTGGGFAGKTGNAFHHSAPDSRHSHAGRSERHLAGHPKEGHGQWHGQANGNTSNGHTLSLGGGHAQPRSADRSFGGHNQNRGNSNSAPRRNGDRPSYTLGRGNNGNSR